MKGSSGKKLIIGGIAVAAAAGGCAGLESRMLGADAERMAVPENAGTADVENPARAADKLLSDYQRDFARITADRKISGNDFSVIGEYSERVASLLLNSDVSADTAAVASIEIVSESLRQVRDAYERHIAENGYARIFVDAEQRSNGRRSNFGGSMIEGGYSVPATLDQVWDAVAASTAEARGASKEKLEDTVGKIRLGRMETKPDSVSDEDYNAARAYVSDSRVQRAVAWADRVVEELESEAVSEPVLPENDVETRNRVSAQVTYENMRALVLLYSGNEMMIESVDGLRDYRDRESPIVAEPVFRACREGINVQYVVGKQFTLTDEQVNAYSPEVPGADAPAGAGAAE